MPQFWRKISCARLSCVYKCMRENDNVWLQFSSWSFLHYSTITRSSYLHVELSICWDWQLTVTYLVSSIKVKHIYTRETIRLLKKEMEDDTADWGVANVCFLVVECSCRAIFCSTWTYGTPNRFCTHAWYIWFSGSGSRRKIIIIIIKINKIKNTTMVYRTLVWSYCLEMQLDTITKYI